MMKSGSWDSDEVLDAIDEIGTQAERAGEIIRHIRRLIRRQEPQRSSVDIEHVISDVVSFVRPRAHDAGIEIQRVKPSSRIPNVLADPIQIEQVLVNLLHNGFEAMEDTPRDKRKTTIEVSTDGNGMVGVAVSDTGKGLPAEVIHKVFDPFFTTKSEGLGIGLSISRSIIESHAGQIKASINSAGGATFLFTLPTEEDADI